LKIIIGIGIMDYAVNLFLVLVGYRSHGRAPIFAKDQAILNMVDPLPQAMALTAIVIGLAITLLLVAIAIRIYEKYGTFDITKIDKLKG
jgi:multisubunit Na+/H+ antiporter MnhC subunit